MYNCSLEYIGWQILYSRRLRNIHTFDTVNDLIIGEIKVVHANITSLPPKLSLQIMFVGELWTSTSKEFINICGSLSHWHSITIIKGQINKFRSTLTRR